MSGSKASWKQFHTRIFGDSAPVTADSLGAWFLLDFPFRYLGSACVLEDSILHPTSSMSGSIRFQNHKNLQKKKQTIGIMSLCGCHPAISVRQEAVLLHRVEHDS